MSVSVVIPVYNKESTIEKSLLSVINQSIPVSEIILINDGSKDKSGKIIKLIVDNNPQINIKYVEQRNKGVSAARNLGIKLSTCDYICFLDADDIWDTNFNDYLVSLIEDFPEAGMYCLHHRVYKNNFTTTPKYGLPEKYRGYVDNFFKSSCVGSLAKTSKICIRRSMFSDSNYLFPEGVVAGEDLYVWIKIALAAKVACENKVVCTVIQEEDDSRGARIGSTPYPLIYFARKENKFDLTYSCKDYIALIGIKHVIADLIKFNIQNAFKRWCSIFRLSPIRAILPYYLYYVFLK